MPKNDWLNQFKIAKYKITYRVKEPITFPYYKGSTLRGGFGYVFRRLCCVNSRVKSCLDCALKDKCAYTYIFETAPPLNGKLKNLSQIPRPFVIEPSLEKKSQYQPDEVLQFGLVLFGRAIDYLPYFIYTFKELGNSGFGKRINGKRSKCFLENGYNISTDSKGELIYSGRDETIRNINNNIEIKNSLRAQLNNSNIVSLKFLTPTRIKYKNGLVVNPEFHIILRSLLHRLSALFYFHCGEELRVDYKSLTNQAEDVKIKENKTFWQELERYSTRQKEKLKFGGFLGEVTYEGDIKPFLPFVLLGQYTHIGKNCTFGLGKYQII